MYRMLGDTSPYDKVNGVNGFDRFGNPIEGNVFEFTDVICIDGVCTNKQTGAVVTDPFGLDVGLVVAGAGGVLAATGLVNPVVGLMAVAGGLFMSAKKKPGSASGGHGAW